MPTTSVPSGGSRNLSLGVGGCADLVQNGRQSGKVLQADRYMLAQRIRLQVIHEVPLRDDVEGFIVPRMCCNDAVRQVTVTPGHGACPDPVISG